MSQSELFLIAALLHIWLQQYYLVCGSNVQCRPELLGFAAADDLILLKERAYHMSVQSVSTYIDRGAGQALRSADSPKAKLVRCRCRMMPVL